MNYLAHVYLSQDNEMVAIGNFIADEIKGKSYKLYSKEIKIGILLHRAIDTYTDKHPIVKQSTKRLHKNYGHYSGVIVDMFYDHFLAKNWLDYCEISLKEYVTNFYEILYKNIDLMPERATYIIPYMIKNNWLESYKTISGISKALNGINTRTKFKSNMNLAVEDLDKYYIEFEYEFTTFFKSLVTYSNNKLLTLQEIIS